MIQATATTATIKLELNASPALVDDVFKDVYPQL